MSSIDLFTAAVSQSPQKVVPPPPELAAFRSLNPAQKRAEEARGFFLQEFIRCYLDQKWTVEIHNKKWFEVLYELYTKKDVYTSTQKHIHALMYKLDEFKSTIIANLNPYEALSIDFRKYPFEKTNAPFGGEEAQGWQ